MALFSIYDSELHVERDIDGGASLTLKMCPAPPVYIKASVTLYLPAAVRYYRARCSFTLTILQIHCSQNPRARCDLFGPQYMSCSRFSRAYI